MIRLPTEDPITALIPTYSDKPDAWVRDNCYGAMCLWALSLAYKKYADIDELKARGFELENLCICLMRSLLNCYMKQQKKLEAFKNSQKQGDSLHAKFNAKTLETVVGDYDWGHLQIDAVSLFLLCVAQMTASGLQIIYTFDEVCFIQNMVFYIEEAYRIPDFGIWERGDKNNQGVMELNASSIGMAKAALESLGDLNLFGSQGSHSSVIHVVSGQSQQCRETDSALLMIASFPAFAIEDPELLKTTVQTIKSKLQGNYGFKRFLRDGYRSPREDRSRLYYESSELKNFDGIESEWPYFFALMMIQAVFLDDMEQLEVYEKMLEPLLIEVEPGIKVVPELYALPHENIAAELKKPHSQVRVPKGAVPNLIGQSLYIIACLLKDKFILPGEIDTLNRRLSTEKRPDLVVQVILLADDPTVQDELSRLHYVHQSSKEVRPICITSPKVLSKVFSHLGVCSKVHSLGRPLREIYPITTSKLFQLGDTILAFYPSVLDESEFYMASDYDFFVGMISNVVQTLKYDWKELGRPIFIIKISKCLLKTDGTLPDQIKITLDNIHEGCISGTRVYCGLMQEFFNTSCLVNISWLKNHCTRKKHSEVEILKKIMSTFGDKKKFQSVISSLTSFKLPKTRGEYSMAASKPTQKEGRQFYRGIIKRSKSIYLPADDSENIKNMNSALRRIELCSQQGSLTSRPSVSESDYPEDQTVPHVLSKFVKESNAPYYDWKTNLSENGYSNLDIEELLAKLEKADSIFEIADITHVLCISKGLNWKCDIGGVKTSVKKILRELYFKACEVKQWWIIRHVAGLLNVKAYDVSLHVTNLLVNQKQVTVGLPPEPREKIIKMPLSSESILDLIHEAYQDDFTSAMVTQEMLRIRVGLIIQVMISELARNLDCSGEDASDHFLNLSPDEMNLLLHQILSGTEFITSESKFVNKDGKVTTVKPHSDINTFKMKIKKDSPNIGICPVWEDIFPLDAKPITKKRRNIEMRDNSPITGQRVEMSPSEIESEMTRKVVSKIEKITTGEEVHDDILETQGQWLRRRRLDGSLNRVPVNFYNSIWKTLHKCHNISIGYVQINYMLTKEMTPGEMKFALHIEYVLNLIPHPEYRQLFVESIMPLLALTSLPEGDHVYSHVNIDDVIQTANQLFLQDQRQLNGDATLCCAGDQPLACHGVEGICQFFYDSAPSGRYGTLSYIFELQHKSFKSPT